MADFHPLAFFGPLAELGIFGVVDFVVVNLIIPANALLIAVFAGWVMARPAIRETLGLSDRGFAIWQVSLRYLAPVAILLALYGSFAS